MTVLGERNNEDTPEIAGMSSGEVLAPTLGVLPASSNNNNAPGEGQAAHSSFQEAGQSNVYYDLMPSPTNTNTTAAPVGTTTEARQQQDEEGAQEEESEMIRKWKESPFAIGLTKATWADDDMGCFQTCLACCSGSRLAHVYCTACICSHLGTGRVGNMIVLRQTMEEVEVLVNNGNRIRIRRPRLRCVVGPYWMVTFLVVVPFFTALSFWVGRRLVINNSAGNQHLAVLLVWTFLTTGLFFSLFQVACSDPGIHYRYSTRPDDVDGGDEWIWNDQALSYRPQHAKFDPEVQCIVSHFDHTCPWTSTAIGGGNILWFYMFLFFVFGTLMYDIILLTFFGH
jgi:DHHC palmitoyltransferase